MLRVTGLRAQVQYQLKDNRIPWIWKRTDRNWRGGEEEENLRELWYRLNQLQEATGH
jgi:hypothetical protein